MNNLNGFWFSGSCWSCQLYYSQYFQLMSFSIDEIYYARVYVCVYVYGCLDKWKFNECVQYDYINIVNKIVHFIKLIQNEYQILLDVSVFVSACVCMCAYDINGNNWYYCWRKRCIFYFLFFEFQTLSYNWIK